MATRPRELAASLLRLPEWRPPAPGRVTHSEVWARARARGGHGVTWTVRLPA